MFRKTIFFQDSELGVGMGRILILLDTGYYRIVPTGYAAGYRIPDIRYRILDYLVPDSTGYRIPDSEKYSGKQ